MLIECVKATVIGFGTMAVVLGPLLILELAFPKSPTSLLSRLRGLTFWVLSLPAYALAQVFIFHLLAPSPLAIIDLTVLPFNPVSGLFVAAVLGDFWFYWMHRAQHKFFWRFHSVHHAIEDVSAANSYHHISEAVFQAVFMLLPAALLVQKMDSAHLFFPMVWAQGLYLHSATRVNFGPLRYLIGDNRFHRIHHSTDPAHFDKNFSGFAPVWDILFGTAHYPKPGAWPPVGLTDQREATTISEWIMRPFSLKVRKS